MKKNLLFMLLSVALIFTSCAKETDNPVKISFDKRSLSLKEGESGTLVPVLMPEDAKNVVLVWESSDPEVASVSGVGVVSALKEGITDIKVTIENTSESAVCRVKVLSSDRVYVVGYENDGTRSVAMVWKDGTAAHLSSNLYHTVATSVAVVGDDVYVAGRGSKEKSWDTSVALYWKNGKPVVLAETGSTVSIAVVGNDVYVAGNRDGGTVYWKNGSLVELPGAGHCNSIFVAGNDVYVAGNESEYYTEVDSYDIAKYWKNNGQAIVLDREPTTNQVVCSIFVDGNDVYIAGTEYKPEFFAGVEYKRGIHIAVYWKNGVKTSLNNDDVSYMGIAIAVSGQNVYVVGCESGGRDLAVYWKNNVLVELPSEAEAVLSSQANAIAVVK